MRKKITILGYGFIGKNLADSYFSEEYDLTIFDRKTCPSNLSGRVNWIQGTFNTKDLLSSAISGADVVYHLISSTVPSDESDENIELTNNVQDTISLLKLCVKGNVKQFIFFSSASVYGTQTTLPISETATTDPISTHGIHKLTIEKYIQYYHFKYGLGCKIIRLSNPYGYGQNLFGRQGLIAICLGKILKGEEVVVMGDGSAVRDFIYIDDVVDACKLISNTQKDELIFNIGSGISYTLNDIFAEFKFLFGDAFKLKYQTIRHSDISASVFNITKSKRLLNFHPGISLAEGLILTIKKYEVEYPVLALKLRK